LGDLGCFSFYANKIVTTGEGGMVVTSSKKLADNCRYYKNLCFPLSGERSYLHQDLGFNYRMTNLQAAIGLAQVEKIDALIDKRRKNAQLYSSLLHGVPGLQLPTEKPYAKNVYWMYGVIVDQKEFGLSRNQLEKALGKRGIETRPFFQPLHRQPVWRKLKLGRQDRFPVSDYLSKNGLLLPSGTGLIKKQITLVCKEIKKLAKH
jgi:perosamine synthetase